MREMSLTEINQVSGADGYTTLAVVGGTFAAGVGGLFVAPAVVGATIFAGAAYLGGYAIGSAYNYFSA